MHAPDAAELVEQFLPLALAVAKRWARAYPPLAADFESDAAYALWRAATAHEPGRGPFVALVRVAVRRAILSRLRKEKTQNPGAFRSAARDDEGLDQLNQAAGREPEPDARVVVEDLLAGLQDDAADIVKLHALEGETFAGIAAAKGDSPARVRRKFRKAAAELRGKIEAWGG